MNTLMKRKLTEIEKRQVANHGHRIFWQDEEEPTIYYENHPGELPIYSDAEIHAIAAAGCTTLIVTYG